MPRLSGDAHFVAGLDEAGRGCLAGPVVAAAVILPRVYKLPGLTDSKKLTPERRQELAVRIRAVARAYALGYAWPREIERINILRASLLAMRRAVLALRLQPARLVVDGNQPVPIDLPQESIVQGDLLVPAISAASILAKVGRDLLMCRLDSRYPGYGLAGHKGYATAEHRECLGRLGPCRLHRRTFAGVVTTVVEEELWLPGISP